MEDIEERDEIAAQLELEKHLMKRRLEVFFELDDIEDP